jgi:hypothetical protein
VSQVESPSFQPRWPTVVACLVFILAALTVCAPMLAGRFLLGNDQLHVGYGFREWGAQMFQQNGALPQWNPLQFGGLPYVGAMHGDIFYPTAWLRWFLPIDTAMNLGIALHIVLAGLGTYLLLRALRLGWTAAVAGGLCYELTGIVISMANPGHDGKMYVSALAPFAFLALLRAIRDQRLWGYGLFALITGLSLLSPHYQMSYYLLVAAGMWTVYLVFFDSDRPAALRWPVPLALAAAAVLLGLGISAIQAIPFMEYLPYSPRGAGGPSAGWEYATSYAFPVKELPTIILPQFTGVEQFYWGGNFLKDHTEYLGIGVVILASLAFGAAGRKRLMWGLGAIAILFLLVAFGGHTPFYRLWYEVMPMMKKVRAPGMAFFLVALVVAVYAAIGVERLLRGQVAWRRVAITAGVIGAIGLLGAVGALQTVAEVLVQPEQTGKLAANAANIRTGSFRLLLSLAATTLVFWLILRSRITGALAAAALGVVLVGDLWSIDREFMPYREPAEILFRPDPIIDRIKSTTPPFRVFDTGQAPGGGGPIYDYSVMMGHDIQSLLGYHGQELNAYDDLLGGKNVWRNSINLGLWDLLAVRYLIVRDSMAVPGFHLVLGPIDTKRTGDTAYLYEADSAPPYVRVMTAAAKIPEDRIVSTVADPRFPYDGIVLYPDSASVTPAPIQGSFIPPSTVTPNLVEWKPGRMHIQLTGTDPKESYLVVSENWYLGWKATVDGNPVPVHRGDNTLISVALPSGAREVVLEFTDEEYALGKMVTLISTLMAFGLVLVPALRRRGGETAGV